MRPLGGLLLTIVGALCAAEACAQPATPSPRMDPAQRALFNAVFAPRPKKPPRQSAKFTTAVTTLGVRSDARVAEGAGGVFAMPAYSGTGLDQTRLLGSNPLAGGDGMVVWRTDEVTLPRRARGAVDTVRVSIGGVARAPGGVVLARPGALLDPDAEAFDVTYTRGWPSAFKLSAGRYQVDVSPHAGFGVNNVGGSAEAGAMVRLGADLEDRLMNRLGLHVTDASAYSGQGRWYLFAAASGRAVGLNMLPTGQGGVQRAGWSADSTNALVSDAQAGLGWRKGMVEASVGYVHRAVKSQTPLATGPVPGSYHDSMVAFSLSISPH